MTIAPLLNLYNSSFSETEPRPLEKRSGGRWRSSDPSMCR